MVPLTSIGEQLKKECTRLGLSAVLGGQEAEVKRVRELFASDTCINKGLFDPFEIQNPEGEKIL